MFLMKCIRNSHLSVWVFNVEFRYKINQSCLWLQVEHLNWKCEKENTHTESFILWIWIFIRLFFSMNSDFQFQFGHWAWYGIQAILWMRMQLIQRQRKREIYEHTFIAVDAVTISFAIELWMRLRAAVVSFSLRCLSSTQCKIISLFYVLFSLVCIARSCFLMTKWSKRFDDDNLCTE